MSFRPASRNPGPQHGESLLDSRLRGNDKNRAPLVPIRFLGPLCLVFLSLLLSACRPPPPDTIAGVASPYGFSIFGWEVKNVTGSWVDEAKALSSPRLSIEEQRKLVTDFFQMAGELGQLQSADLSNGAASRAQREAELRKRVDKDAPRVTAILEGQVTDALREEGFGLSLLKGHSLLLPPLRFRFSSTPYVLVISPRDRIELTETFLLSTDLSLANINDIEARIQKLGYSAYIEQTGGIGTYPSMVPENGSLRFTLETIAHEWTHQYLFFHPLGQHYFTSYQMTSINETVANMTGKEAGAKAAEIYALKPPQPVTSSFDFAAAMREIRAQVDGLLAAGKVDEAEQYMEQQRQFLATKGYRLRKLNQAYLAWHSSYSDDPAFLGPIGQQLQELRRRSPSLAAFVNTAAGISRPEDLTELLKNP